MKKTDQTKLMSKLIDAEALRPLTHKRLLELFIYDENTGKFIRRIGTASNARAGSNAGTPMRGYVNISIDSRKYRAHRLAWLYVNGKWPEGFIDHINGIRDDNRISNLRLATMTENRHNQRTARSDSKTGVIGVQWDSRKCRYFARITVDGKCRALGYFKEIGEAAEAYLYEKRKVHSTCSI